MKSSEKLSVINQSKEENPRYLEALAVLGNIDGVDHEETFSIEDISDDGL